MAKAQPQSSGPRGVPTPHLVDENQTYLAAEFRETMNIGRDAYRTLKAKGLPTFDVAGREFVAGKAFWTFANGTPADAFAWHKVCEAAIEAGHDIGLTPKTPAAEPVEATAAEPTGTAVLVTGTEPNVLEAVAPGPKGVDG